MRAYSKQVESLKFFNKLQIIGFKPDKFTFLVVLKACGNCLMISTGGSLHLMAFKYGFSSDLHVNNTLLRMYAGFGAIGLARQVFEEMLERDIVSWRRFTFCPAFQGHNTQLFLGCLGKLPSDALLLFQYMKLANEKPNSITLVSLLGACTRILNIRLGKCIHSHIITSGIEQHVELETPLLGMYAKCGYIEQAFRIFNSMDDKNLQTWTIMMSGLADHGHGEEALSLFARMEEAGFRPDRFDADSLRLAMKVKGIKKFPGSSWVQSLSSSSEDRS
ncbi:hypothetical protein RND71_002128 [Anisodus tanguticus]|uniref:Pentatricopeptide repeat-containing protein n=1 Tax=Anisodus tanguticus TaxID=243964 RepID=A0AAE1T2A6_9SOLA|nr:hypothetical protein RND71_002128 [Anisodus tanguticus]